MTPSAGWYPDPSGGTGVRYWNGRAWTEARSTPTPRSWATDPKVITGVVGGAFILGLLVAAIGGDEEPGTVTSTVTRTVTVTASPPPMTVTAQAPTVTIQAETPTAVDELPPVQFMPDVPEQIPPPQVVSPPVELPSPAYYSSCAAARGAGVAPLYAGEPGYRGGLDRDGDGVACE
jgi:hypothetical protein